jgi:thiol-disulfide isomerase/thioredoxin
MTVRLLVVLALLALFAAAPVLYRLRQARLQRGPTEHPPVPVELRNGAERTWLLFTTPWCATCEPVEQRLRTADPGAHVVKVDASRQPDLAREFAVRTAPTAVLADADGAVQARLVGVEAVDRFLSVSAT